LCPIEASKNAVIDTRLTPPTIINVNIMASPMGLQYVDVFTIASPVMVMAEVAVNRATSKLVKVPRLLAIGRDNRMPPKNDKSINDRKKIE
tara:strand:+ start:166 stop:438 length:273 start_codon:yes stop_codon:yes gene_type:complete